MSSTDTIVIALMILQIILALAAYYDE